MSENLSYEQIVRDARQSAGSFVRVERDGDIALVTLSDPPTLNALSAPLTVQLRATLDALIVDSSVRAVVLTGAGGAFSAGGDVRAMAATAHPLVDESDEGAVAMWRWIRQQFTGVVRTIVESEKPFVAAIAGAAAGVGLAFAMACDLVVAATDARLLTAFGRIGLVPEVGLSWLLTHRVGHHKAFELYVRGEAIEAREAERLGLVNEVVTAGQEVARAKEWARRALLLSPPALAMTKPLLRAAANVSFQDSLVLEEFAEPMCFTTSAHRDAVRSFLARASGR